MAVASVPIVLFFLFRGVFTPAIKYNLVRTAIAEYGDMTVTISGSGVVIPNYEEIIGAPFNSKILRVNNQPGDKITREDTLMILDNETTLNELTRLLNELELMQIRKKRLETELVQIDEDFKIDREIMELRIEGLKSDYDNEKYMNNLGGSPREMVVKAEAELKIAQLESEKAELTHANDLNSRKSALEELVTEIRIQHTLISEARQIVSQAFVKAPFDGDLGMINDNPGVMVQKGQEIARVADYSRYKMRGTVSNSWTGQIQTGQRVIVKDKENILEGSIESIAPSVTNGMLNFTIRIDTGNMDQLRPNQQLEIRVIIAYKDRALRIPNGSYYTSNGYKEMFVIRKGIAYRTKVLLGEANFEYVEILGGLEEGDEIVLEDISNKYERNELKVKR